MDREASEQSIDTPETVSITSDTTEEILREWPLTPVLAPEEYVGEKL